MKSKRVRRKCRCCGTWKNVFVMWGQCQCNSCFRIVLKRKELHREITGEYLNFNDLYKELKTEIEHARANLTYSWS